MKTSLDRFILGFPVLFLKQYPYAWIAVVVLWTRSPSLAAAFLVVIAAGILALRWQHAAWISQIRQQHAGQDGKFYLDEPPVPWTKTIRNITILIAFSLVAAFVLQGRLGLNFWQFFIMAVGFMIFYRDTDFFGSTSTYIITATGIGIRVVPWHLDYRLFLPFKEISRIERGAYKPNSDTSIFARIREAEDGLLLTPKDPKGFTTRIHKLFIVPRDVDKFVEQLPYGFK